MHGVAARHRPADQVGHDVAAARLRGVAGLVRQFGQGVAGDATAREGQGGLLIDAQRLGRLRLW